MQPYNPSSGFDPYQQIEQLNQEKKKKKKNAAAAAVIIILIASILLIYLRWGYFKVQKIAVAGLESYSYSTAIQTAEKGGLKIGVNLASIDPKKVEKAINADYHFIFDSLILDYAGRGALLVVKERKSLTVIEHNGALYSISSDGYVMGSVTEETDMPKTTGLNVTSAVVGRKIIDTSNALQYLRVILYELEKQKLLSSVTEISMSRVSENEITLYLDNSRCIVLGDGTHIMKKLMAARTMMDLAWRISAHGGETFDVSDPEKPRIRFPATGS